MIPRSRRGPGALTCALLLAAGGWAGAHAEGPEPAPRPALAETMENARLLVAIGHFDEALLQLRAHRKAGATDAELLFLLGLASAGKVQHRHVAGPERQVLLDEAAAAFRRVLAARPEYVRARIELATVFFLMEDDRLARKHFEQALADELPSWVAAHIHLFLAKMDARKRKPGYHPGTYRLETLRTMGRQRQSNTLCDARGSSDIGNLNPECQE